METALVVFGLRGYPTLTRMLSACYAVVLALEPVLRSSAKTMLPSSLQP